MSINLDNLPKGTKVKIVDKWRRDDESGYQNSSGQMNGFLGSYLTIRSFNGDTYTMEEDNIQWSWSPELFEKVKIPDSDTWYSVEFSPLLDNYIAKEINNNNNIIEDKAKYYVFVSGFLHDTLEAAEKEAKRLSEREVGSLVSICKVEKQFISKVIVEEV